MNKDNEHTKLMRKIIKEIVKAKEETDKEKYNEMDEKEGIIEKIEIEKNRALKLQENTKFFKATLDMADSLIKTIEFAEKEGRSIGQVSMSEILTGILVVFEERGFIKIIEKEKRD